MAWLHVRRTHGVLEVQNVGKEDRQSQLGQRVQEEESHSLPLFQAG